MWREKGMHGIIISHFQLLMFYYFRKKKGGGRWTVLLRFSFSNPGLCFIKSIHSVYEALRCVYDSVPSLILKRLIHASLIVMKHSSHYNKIHVHILLHDIMKNQNQIHRTYSEKQVKIKQIGLLSKSNSCANCTKDKKCLSTN